MADEPWLLKEDGYLNVDTTLKQIIYHPSLNVILICSEQELVRVLDVNSGVVLQTSRLSAQDSAKLTCRYLTGQDRVLFCDGYGLGVRSDYNGVLLLDTILQKPVQNPRDVIKLELLLSEAILLKQNLILMSQFVIDQQSEVINELCDKIAEAQKQSKKGIKAQKWNTVCLELPLEQLKRVAEMTVTEFTLKNQHVPELAVAAAVQERLSELLAEPPPALDRSAMASEARRRDTFSKWPHMDYKWALPDQMAQAGFYHQPNSSGDDRAMCFTCTVCLVCWERTDEPWAEHERHSPNCPFVCGEYTQNVPLSVTYATQPAQDATYRGVPVSKVGTTGVGHLVVTANGDGLVTVYDVSGKLKRTHSFYVTQYDSPILECCMQEFGHNYSWSNLEDGRSVTITSVSVIGEQKSPQPRLVIPGGKETTEVKPDEETTSTTLRPAVVCGLTIKGRPVSEPKPNDMIIENSLPDTTTCLCLVVYDFSYTKDSDREAEVTKTNTKMSNIVISMINDMDYNLMDASNSFINEYQALKMLKQTESNNYQNLIPGESDDIFLPPPTSGPNSGTRVLVVDDEEPDASSSQNFQFLNGDALGKPEKGTEKSISDHISELKSSKNKKLNYSHAVQCIALPERYKNLSNLEIWDILPTRGCSHILVILRSLEGEGGVLLVYEVIHSGAVARLRETPCRVRDLTPVECPREASLVPAPDQDQAPLAVIVSADGATRVYDIDSLRIVSMAKLETQEFVSAVYCNSLERLCLATSTSLHFFPLLPPVSPGTSPPLSPSGSVCELSVIQTAPTQTPCPGLGSAGELTLQELRALRRLTEFEALGPAHQCCVSVPPCWSEMQQQRQRRHDDAAGRTWRLQTDTTTWDEHIFEITLPWAVNLGHMDVHFSLHGPQPSPPHVEVTLLRQNTSGIGHRRAEVHFQVDEAVSFECLQRSQNPVTSREYLRSHNADILAGPVNLAHCLDLSEHNGCVTLTSPKLFKTNTRTLLLHIKALCDPSKDPPLRKDFKRSHSSSKTDYLGCDCLHELSITMYRARSDSVVERSQRSAMLESGAFLAGLVRAAASLGNPARQHAALDLLLWLAAVRLAPSRDASARAPTHQMEALHVLEQGMHELFTACLLHSGRSVAHKCVKLMVICSEGARNISDTCGRDFDSRILQVLLGLIPGVCGVWSAGALHWLVALALRVSRDSPHTPALTAACISLLRDLAAEMAQRTNPYHLLLRARFGLWGTPLEPELFELEPPPAVKPSSVPVTYSSVVAEPPHVFSEALEPKDVFLPPGSSSTGTSSNSSLGLTPGSGKGRNLPSKHMRGLLETEPLHFACVATSDGTRVERFDAAVHHVPTAPTPAPPVPPPAVHTQNTHPHLAKKDTDDVNKDKENAMLTEFQHDFNMASSSTPKDIYPKEITQFLLNADIQKGNGQDWPLLTNKLDVLEMTIDDDICPPDQPAPTNPPSKPPTSSWRADTMDMLAPPLAQHCSLHQLLVAPPQQVMVVERMQSGARRFVTLDFGAPVLLTDVMIPACHDLVSLSLDLWLRGPDTDGVRLVLATDIGTKTLVLSDLQPPPICRYIKITTIGRYGMSTTRCKIPIGNFYGHLLILPEEAEGVEGLEKPDLEASLALLGSLLEDVHCRYSLACSRLTDLLQPLLAGDITNATHMATYMYTYNNHQENITLTPENQKVFAAYGEAIMYQRQLNIVQGVIKRIERSLGTIVYTSPQGLVDSCTDKLRVIAESLLDIILSLNQDLNNLIDRQTCEMLFHGFCVPCTSRIQTLTAGLLVKACGRQPFWGDFISDTILKMYTSSYTMIFPLDRVFMLLTYLGKKSPERGIVLDSNLRILVELLQEGCSGEQLLAVNSDLALLGWVLLYASWQLDHTFRGDLTCVKRWSWVTGDQSTKPQDSGVCTGSHRRKVHRRFIHYKQQIDQLDWTKKAVQASTQVQALSALSSQAASLSSKLEAALKQQEHVFKRIKQFSSKQKELSKARSTNATGSGSSQGRSQDPPEHTVAGVPLHQLLDAEHSLAVSRGLVAFLLHMDHSCSSDLFLLACKVLARLVVMSRLSLSSVLTPGELHTLLARCVASEPPWAQHGLACLLLDMLDTSASPSPSTASATSSTISTTATASSTSTSTTTQADEDDGDDEPGPSFTPQTDAEMFDSFSIDDQLIPDKPKSNPLPSVFESDDSELDDFLDDILERGRSLLRRQGSGRGPGSGGTVSSAMDARLELGVETGAEILLRRLTALSAGTHAVASPAEPGLQAPPAWPEHLVEAGRQRQMGVSNTEMLTQCFNQLFGDMQLMPNNIENTVRLWLTLNKTSSKGVFNPSGVPSIPVSGVSVCSLMSALAYSPGLTLRAWCVALQALTLMCNMTNNSNSNSSSSTSLESTLNGMAAVIINHQDFVNLLLRLLSGSGLVFSDKGLAGPSVCRALHDLLLRLLMRCDVVSAGSAAGVRLKELLLTALLQLVQPSGALALRHGPLDVQCKFLHALLHLDYSDANLNVLSAILESTGVLVGTYVSNIERIKCVNLGERNSSVGNNFSGLFASVLGSDSSKQDRPASWDSLLVALLKLLTRLVQSPVPTNVQPSSPLYTNTQTDEFKSSHPPPLTVADSCLRQHTSILRFLHCLTAFSSSSLAMLLSLPAGGGTTAQTQPLAELGEPASLGDAVFQLLSVLVAKARDKRLILQPLVAFLRAVEMLSEPTVWFVLKVLSEEDMVEGFVHLDGVRVLAESLVRSSKSLTALQHGTISLVMHHLSTQHAQRSDATLSYAAPSFSKKVQQANLENAESLVNFAPMGSIRCHSGTAQPADILIQSAVASHRRARTPQWCYHFYPDETHTELTIRLPSAVLLREVQLQPHLSSLSTCPSAVALEVSNGSPDHLVPACPPLPTSGMTFIRLHLPTPEVVTHVLLRLYKPRDASNIGLSQIRLLGTSAFGKPTTTADVEEEEHFTRYSLGWLRLLHHCLTLPSDTSGVLRSLGTVPGLLQACCALLLAPSHVPALYLPQLQRVLCRLALAERAAGLTALRLLLAGRAPTLTSPHPTLCEVMQQLCTTQDANTPYRMSEILGWLERTASTAITRSGISDSCSPAFLTCIASILWCAQADHVPYSLPDLLTPNLLDLLFRWSQLAVPPLKHALDALLCSTTYIQPNFFPSLLQRLNVLVPNTSTSRTASISDDRKDSDGLTDDSKLETESEWYGRLILVEYSQLVLSESQLATIAMVSRSPPAIQQLLDSGLPKLLIKAILEFCSPQIDKVPMARLENITSILYFLSEVSAEQTMKDWLGSPDGSIFWLPLLQFLCKKPDNKLKNEPQARLEEICVRFLSKCCLCHKTNQKLLARVLCEVISQQSSGISGFLRRLVLQLLLENEKVLVCIKADESVQKISPLPQPNTMHPSYKRSHDRLLLHLNTNTSIGEILEQHVAFATMLKSEAKPKELVGAALAASALQAAKEIWEIGIEADHVSMAAAVTAKDKRAKDAKNQSVATPQLKKKRYGTGVGNGSAATDTGEMLGGRQVRCEQLGDVPLPHTLTLAQLLAMLEDQPNVCMDLHLTITHSKEERTCRPESESLVQHRAIGNALQVFSSMGGLALLAQHLPAVYPELVRPAAAAAVAAHDKASTADNHDTDWVKVEGSDDIYEDLDDLPAPKPPPLFPNVPPHSLTSFSLFLRLPGYADILLKDWRRALCLLRLVLGVTDDGHGADIFLSAAAEALPTLPFHVLRQLYEATPIGTDDGRLLRQISVSIGVTSLLLGCLGVFTHQTHTDGYKSEGRTEEKSQLYWAKGTGFGTGSTQQSWNVEQALLRQRSEEEHVTVLLQVLASYINPCGQNLSDHTDHTLALPQVFYDQLATSCLLPALSSYLRNDSVLDMARHIPLYRSVLQVLRAMALSQQLVALLLPRPNGDSSRPQSVVSLLLKMKSCVDNYTCRLRFNKTSGGNGSGSGGSKLKFGRYEADEETDEGLALLMPDIQDTASMVQAATSCLGGDEHDPLAPSHPLQDSNTPEQSLEQRYLDVMKRLQFDTFEMLTDSPDGPKFVVSYHFEGNVRSAGDQSQPARVKRLAQEAVTLATSLPLSYSSSVFVRCDTDRLDIMKVLITGPADTPYANGCFELDVYFPPDYPNAPMLINLETTGHHTVRFNPNLYNDGKVCLSVLNTWHGRPEEKWNSQTSSFLQVLVSIQSLILVPEPYFNEPGYERSRGTPQGSQSSREYNTNICQATVRWAMLEQILNPCPCFRDVIHAHFWLKRHEILSQVEAWIRDLELQLAEKKARNSSKRTTLTNLETFKKNYHQLKDQLLKLQPPEGLVVNAEDTATMTTTMAPCDTELNDVEMEKIVNDVCE